MIDTQQKALQHGADVLRSVSDQLRKWAIESREGGWSTHQVDPQVEMAKSLLVDAQMLESFAVGKLPGGKVSSEQNPTQKGPSIVKPPEGGGAPPPPNCPGCGEPLPGIYLYVFQLAQPAPLPTLLFQAMCCPREKCLTAITILPAGEVPNQIQTPGSAWPI